MTTFCHLDQSDLCPTPCLVDCMVSPQKCKQYIRLLPILDQFSYDSWGFWSSWCLLALCGCISAIVNSFPNPESPQLLPVHFYLSWWLVTSQLWPQKWGLWIVCRSEMSSAWLQLQCSLIFRKRHVVPACFRKKEKRRTFLKFLDFRMHTVKVTTLSFLYIWQSNYWWAGRWRTRAATCRSVEGLVKCSLTDPAHGLFERKLWASKEQRVTNARLNTFCMFIYAVQKIRMNEAINERRREWRNSERRTKIIKEWWNLACMHVWINIYIYLMHRYIFDR